MHRAAIIACLSILACSSVSPAQAPQLVRSNDKIDSCFTRHIHPGYDILPDDRGLAPRVVRCTEPSQRLCDVSANIEQHNYAGIRCLVDAGYDFNVESGQYDTKHIPIMWAAMWDDEILKLIFESKIPINTEVKDSSGDTAFVRITRFPKPGGVLHVKKTYSYDRLTRSADVLLAKGADPDVSVTGSTPLMIQSGSLEGAKFVAVLLRHGADPDRQSLLGETALMMAEDYADTIKLLLDANANIYLKDNDGNAAIFHAIKGCQVDKVRALKARDDKILESVNRKGITALKYRTRPGLAGT